MTKKLQKKMKRIKKQKRAIAKQGEAQAIIRGNELRTATVEQWADVAMTLAGSGVGEMRL